MRSRPLILKLILLATAAVELCSAASTATAPDLTASQLDVVQLQPADSAGAATSSRPQSAAGDCATAAAPQTDTTDKVVRLQGVNVELAEELRYCDSTRLGVIRDRDWSAREIQNPLPSGASDLRRGFIMLGAGIQIGVIGACVIGAFEPRTPAGFVIPLLPASGLLVMATAFLHSGKAKKTRHLNWEKYHAN
jgi:hypothetical protein